MRTLLIPTILALAPLAAAQVDEAWSTTLDRSPVADFARDGYVDGFGTTTLVGSRSTGPNDFVATIARVDAFSAVIFERDFVLPAATTEFLEVEPDGQGGFYARGRTVPALGAPGALLVRYDADGNVLWSVTDPTLFARDVALDPSGDVWVVGSAGSDVGVRRYTSDGTLLASTSWDSGPNMNDLGNAIAPDRLGGAYVAGRVSGRYALVLKLDPAGNAVWSRTSALSSESTAQSVAVGPTGDVYIGGLMSMVLAAPKYAVVAFGPGGDLLWSNLYSAGSHPRGVVTDLVVDAQGDIVAVGNAWWWEDHEGDVIVRKLSPAGNALWTLVWSSPSTLGWDVPESAVVDAAGDVFIAGQTSNQTDPLADAFALRIERHGALRWSKTFGTAGANDVATVVGVSAPGTVFVGANVADGADIDVRLVRYDEAVAPFCFGDGSGIECPCGNDSTAWDRAGCMNSLGSAGKLDGADTPSLADDTLVLVGSGMTNSSALYFQGGGAVAGGAGAVFGDGLLCASAPNVRLATRANAGGGSSYPGAGEPRISVRGGVLVPGERTYQVWYRNAAAFCTSATFNLTNGVRVTWAP